MGAFNAAADAFKLIKKSHFVKRLSAQICQVPTANCLEHHLDYGVAVGGGASSPLFTVRVQPDTFDYCSLKHMHLLEMVYKLYVHDILFLLGNGEN